MFYPLSQPLTQFKTFLELDILNEMHTWRIKKNSINDKFIFLTKFCNV